MTAHTYLVNHLPALSLSMAFSSSYETPPPMSSSYKTPHDNNTTTFHSPSSSQQVVAVVVPFPAQGHLNQLLHLSRLLLSRNIPVHFVGSASHNRQVLLRSHGSCQGHHLSNIHIHDFQLPSFPSPPPHPNTRFPSHLLPSFQASTTLRQPFFSLLQSLSSVSKRVLVIHDSLMASVVQDVIHLPNCETYTFHSVSAFTMFFYFWDTMGRPQVKQNDSNTIIPQVPSLEGCFTTEFIHFVSSQYEFHKLSKGTIYNTTRAIERPYMELIERIITTKAHWALGPFNPLSMQNTGSHHHPAMEWLDKKEERSVLYVSFGTTTCFSEEQIKEVASGLENSKVKFLWVVRDADKGDVFNNDEGGGVAKIPKGFEERVKGVGLVVRDWAPQLEILAHPSTGGFMSHCGWNSCMESISMGVPIAAWPMHSDQPRNRVLVTDVLKVGIVVKEWEHRDELVTMLEVENAVRRLMTTEEGDEMRERALKLKNAIHEAADEGGVSRVEFDDFIAHVTR